MCWQHSKGDRSQAVYYRAAAGWNVTGVGVRRGGTNLNRLSSRRSVGEVSRPAGELGQVLDPWQPDLKRLSLV